MPQSVDGAPMTWTLPTPWKVPREWVGERAFVICTGESIKPQREMIHQLQGRAGDRQVAGARTALITAGGFFFNSQGCILRADDA